MTSSSAPSPIPQPPLSPTSAETLAGLGFVGLVALFFGSGPTFARLAFEGGTGPLTLQFVRFSFAAVGLWLLLSAIGRLHRIPTRSVPLLIALVALSGGASYGYMTSVRSIPVPVASLVFFTFPLIVGPLAHLLGDERLTPRRILAMAVGFAGIVLVLRGGLAQADNAGLLMAFGAGTCVAFSFQVSRRLTADIPPMVLTATVASVNASVCTLLVLLQGSIDLPTSARGWIGVAGNAVSYTVGLSCLFAAIQRLGVTRTAIASNLEPVFSVLLAGAVLNQSLSGIQVVGALIVLTGILLAQSDRRAQPTPGTARR